MTNVEKEMNKNDLFAYKVFDNNQYALIPGHTHQKAIPDPNHAPPKKNTQASPVNRNNKGTAILNEDKVRKHEDRLQQYGLLNVNRSPNMRHNGDKTLERSLEFPTELPMPKGSPAQAQGGLHNSRADIAGNHSSLYQSQRRYGGGVDPLRPYSDIGNTQLNVPAPQGPQFNTIDHSASPSNATFANRNNSIQARGTVDQMRPMRIGGATQSIDAGAG